MPAPPIHLVWLKRDLRLRDHPALTAAARAGAVLPLYIHEPDLARAELDASHIRFINASLDELETGLRDLGVALLRRTGSPLDVLEQLHRELLRLTDGDRGLAHVHSHEETGTRLTFDRDRAVRRTLRRLRVPWTEHPQRGVFRPNPSRDDWARRWNRRMSAPPLDPPARDQLTCARSTLPDPAALDTGAPETPESLGLRHPPKPGAQTPGEAAALDTLRSFLDRRGVNYQKDISSPTTADTGGSRLSTHLAWGTISVRTVLHETRACVDELAAAPDRDPRWLRSLRSFQSRLHWRDHFTQKLEDEPDIEFRNMNRAYDGLRTEDPDDWTDRERARFDAWCAGSTGYPMVDACMRCLHHTGWINFRMRAMLVSFLAHHLWIHWRPGALFLARHFLDYEPGIHFPQFQMQSGTTGINTVRIYSPIKQAADHDPAGVFIRRWLPELAALPDEHLAEPHRTPDMTQHLAGCRIPGDYPAPIVDHARAYAHARDRIFALRKTPGARAEAQRVYNKHGSRKRPTQRTRPYKGSPEHRAGAQTR